MPPLIKVFILSLTVSLSSLLILQFIDFDAMQSSAKEDTHCMLYPWYDPNTNNKEAVNLVKNCAGCHMAYYKEWVSDKHSMSQNNPFFLSIYSGTDINGKENIYPGFKLDHPKQNGNCALCHNPEAALDNNFDVNARKKSNGISCNFCHKIESVDKNLLKQGVRGLKVPRVCVGEQDIGFGPLNDIIESTNVVRFEYNPLYKESLFCAKCHDGFQGNTQIYSTFTEWLNSPASKQKIQCQNCHMPSQNKQGKISFIDNPKVKGKLRPYSQIHSHMFLTNNSYEFRKKFVDLRIEARRGEIGRKGDGAMGRRGNKEKSLIVKAIVKNKNIGHNFPTGSTMRNAILIIEVKDKNGNDLRLIKGSKLPNYAGELRGKPGRLFAKILSETNSQYATQHGKRGIEFRKVVDKLGIPSQDWWNVFILSDTRIKANEEDISTYEFEVKDDITITAKLIWRNTWEGFAKVKGLELREDVLIEKKLLF